MWSVLSCFGRVGGGGLGWAADGGKKAAVCCEKQRAFWRAKVSLFGRERVAAFLVGDLECANRDQDGADFRLDAALPRRDDLSVSRNVSPTRHFRHFGHFSYRSLQ